MRHFFAVVTLASLASIASSTARADSGETLSQAEREDIKWIESWGAKFRSRELGLPSFHFAKMDRKAFKSWCLRNKGLYRKIPKTKGNWPKYHCEFDEPPKMAVLLSEQYASKKVELTLVDPPRLVALFRNALVESYKAQLEANFDRIAQRNRLEAKYKYSSNSADVTLDRGDVSKRAVSFHLYSTRTKELVVSERFYWIMYRKKL